jgi:membrane associated rhomboid family serine protease
VTTSNPATPPQTPTCYRHSDRTTYVSCTRCDRFICPECMRDATVGQQCVECVRADRRTAPQARTQFGGRVRSGAPAVTYALIGVNVVAFVLQTASAGLESHLTLWPPAVADGQLYRLVTSAFLHYGPTHLLLNMWALYVVGPPLERWLGRLRFGALYASSALGGSVLVYLIAPLDTATAGASGAIFGLFGATLVVLRRLDLDYRWVVVVIALNLIFTLVVPIISSAAISWQAHVGGLVTGAAVASAYVYAPRHRRDVVQTTAIAGALLLFATLVWWRTGALLAEAGGHFFLR